MLRAALLAVQQGRRAQGLSQVIQLLRYEKSSLSPLVLTNALTHETATSPGTRSFAAAAEPQAERVQLPARVTGLAGKYASALYIAGYKANALDQIDDDLIEVWNTAARSKEFKDFLKDPSIPKSVRASGLEAVLTELKVSDITKRFFGVLADNNRLREILRISNAFDKLMSAARGEVTATITTAAALGREQLDEIKSGLDQILEDGQTLIIQEQVDPSLIGGIIIDVGDKHIDLSISSQVKRLQQLMLETV